MVFLFCCALLVVVQDIALAPGVPLPSSSIDVNHGNDESFPGVEKSDSDPLIQNNLPRRAARSWLPPQTLVDPQTSCTCSHFPRSMNKERVLSLKLVFLFLTWLYSLNHFFWRKKSV